MGNGGFTAARLNRKVFQRAGRNQKAQTRVLMLSPSLLLNNLDTQSRKAKLSLPATPIGIVEYLRLNTFVGNPLSKQLSVKWSLTGGEKETFLKVIIVSYERWSLTIESKYRDLTWKLLVF